jgi:hypothetical protein
MRTGRASSVHAGTPTVVTAGRRAVFAIQIRDAFGNPVEHAHPSTSAIPTQCPTSGHRIHPVMHQQG